jgi:chromosome segregation ATPase
MMDPMQVKLNSIHDNQSSINKKIAKLESKGEEARIRSD